MPHSDPALLGDLVQALLHSRHSVPPKRLGAPGPDDAQLGLLLEAAATAPDHRSLQPWRFICIPDAQRPALAELFAACTLEREPQATPAELAASRAKAHHAPLLLLAVLRLGPPEPEVPDTERAISLGAALMALLLSAHGQGFAGMLTSGRAVRTARFAQAFALGADEQAVCFVALGTAQAQRKRPRPAGADRLSHWPGPAPLPAPG